MVNSLKVFPLLFICFLQMKQLPRNMTVPSRILFQILLMIFFRGEEIPDRADFHRKLLPGFFFLLLIYGSDLRELILFRIVDSGAVLDTKIVPLPVYGERVDR